jgi:hypothetical protein
VRYFIGSTRAEAANGPETLAWRIDVKPPQSAIITTERQVDWDRIGVVFVTFGIACSGVATLLYSVGFLIQALAHHA